MTRPVGRPPKLFPGGAGGPTRQRFVWPLVTVAVIVALFVVPHFTSGSNSQSLSYSQFVTQVDQGRVTKVTIAANGNVSGSRKASSDFTSQVPTALSTSSLLGDLQSHNVKVTATAPSSGGGLGALLLDFLPLLLIIGVFVWIGRKARRTGGGGMGGLGGLLGGVGRSKTKVIDEVRPATRFADVAGYDGVKREVSEVIDFLRSPQKYQRAGAVGPKGVLMVGPPGVGKTLMARAVAGEASVPFLSVDGSSFVEMFVGVGAARVRDLFEQARKSSPSIIFIDEIDSLGSRSSGAGGMGGTNDEREQTLHQMLSELDGFEPATNVVVIAATNRPDALDKALLRPGRFDRQVTVSLPTRIERAAILAVHTVGKSLAGDVDLDVVARSTPGFSGADLANLTNEAAIFAVRGGRTTVTAEDFSDARDRLILGRRDESQALLPDEQQRIAVHESGHALVATLSEHADVVSKVTILPSGQALGATHQLPDDERHIISESQLLDALAVRLGGRAAELVIYGEGSTGAANDVTSATKLALRMVRDMGLSRRLGPVGYGTGRAEFLGSDDPNAFNRPYSEATQRVIDEEISDLVREAEASALTIIRSRRADFDRLVKRLVAEETLDGQTVRDILSADHRAA